MDDQATQDDTDIDLSRGRRAENDATRWYQNTIRNQAPAYFEEDNRNGRRAIVTEILNQMNGHGYRFRWNGANDTRTLNPEVVRQSFYYVLHNDQQRTILLQEGIASPTQIDQWRRLNPLTDIGQVDQWANNPNNLDPAMAAHHADDIRQNLPDFIGGNDDIRHGIVIDITGLDEMMRRRRVAEDLNRANQRRDDANNGGGGDDGNDTNGEEDQSGNDSSNEESNDEEGDNDGNDTNGEEDQEGGIDNSNEGNNDEDGGNDSNEEEDQDGGNDNSSEGNNDEGNEFDEEEDHSGIKTKMKGLIDYEEKIKSQRKQEVTSDILELKSGIEEMEGFKLEIESLEQEKRISRMQEMNSRMQEINSRREEMDSQSEEMSSCMQEINSRMQEVYSFIQEMNSSEQETDTSSVVKEMDSLWEEMEILPMGSLRQKKIRHTKIEIDDMEFHIQSHEMISRKLEEESDMLEIVPQYATKKVSEKRKS